MSCLLVLVLGMGGALAHLLRADSYRTNLGAQADPAHPGQPAVEDPRADHTALPIRPERLAQARPTATTLNAAGQRVSRRTLRSAGVRGSTQNSAPSPSRWQATYQMRQGEYQVCPDLAENVLVSMSATGPAAHDSVVVARFLLDAAAAGGADARQMARDAQLPTWAFTADHATIPSRHSMQLWELAEHALEDRHIPMTIASRHQAGQLDLFDYLFITAATFREGLRASRAFMHLLSTNSRLQVEVETDRETTYSYRHMEPGGRGEELCLQFAIATFCARAQAATGQPVVPARVAFAQPPPRSPRPLIEMLGTRRIDFGAPVTTFTLRASDLDLPLRGADPALAGILTRYAATLAPPPVATWQEHFQQRLAQAIEAGAPSLDTVARRMAVSDRTLQRQLAAHGTTWRAELDSARHALARQAHQTGPPSMARLARQLGYSEPRAARRALRRWQHDGTEPPG